MGLSEYLRSRERDYLNKKDVHASMIEKGGIVRHIEVRFEPNCGANEFQSIVGCIHDMSDEVLIVTSGPTEFEKGALSIKVKEHDYELDKRAAGTMQVLLDYLLPNLGK